MGTPFIEIYDMFLYSIRNEEILKGWEIDPEAIESMFQDLLFKSADLDFKRCAHDLSKRDDEAFEAELSEEEKRILALAMKINFLSSNVIANEQMLADHFFTKDYKVFSPANRLKELRAVEEADRDRLRTSIRVYEYSVLMGDNDV